MGEELVFILGAIDTPILGAVKLIDALLNIGIPYASYIGISGIQNPFIVCILCIIIIIGVALYLTWLPEVIGSLHQGCQQYKTELVTLRNSY